MTHTPTFLAVEFSLQALLVLSLYFDLVFAGASVLLWWIHGGRISGAVCAVIPGVVCYWIADKTGLEILSVAGLFLLAYFAFVTFVSVVMEWDGRWIMIGLTVSSLVLGIGLQFLDYNCGLHHWVVPSIQLVC